MNDQSEKIFEYQLLTFMLCFAIVMIVFWFLVATPMIENDNMCRTMFPPNNSSQTYTSYEHCTHYPEVYKK